MGEMNIDNIKAQMRKGILEYCILSIISRNDAYASSIIAELKAAAGRSRRRALPVSIIRLPRRGASVSSSSTWRGPS